MLVNFVRVSALAVLKTAKLCLIVTQPPRKGGRRNHARRKPQSSTSTVAYALSIRNLPLSVAVAAARDGRPGASQGGAATTAARPPSPSLLSLAVVWWSGMEGRGRGDAEKRERVA